MISQCQRSFENMERVKRCIEVSPSAPRTLKCSKEDRTSRRGLSFVCADEHTDQQQVQSSTEKEFEVRK